MGERPDWHLSWPDVPDGYEVVAVADPEWRTETYRKCRRKTGKRAFCSHDAVAAFHRTRYGARGGKRDEWWAYCPEHMYGRWVEDGKVMSWILREKEAADA